MSDLGRLFWCALIGLFRSRASLEAEILVLRHQLNVLRRSSQKRVTLSSIDRLLLVGLYRLAPGVLDALKIIRPATLLGWHRAGFRAYWRWKSRSLGGRPSVPADIRHLIREMSVANPLWGAPRIHGELLKLGIDVGQTTVAKYMARRRRPPSQGWKTFLRNHADGIASMDLFVVPTVSFRLLYGLLILLHGRRQLLWLDVTAHPSAEWIAHQLTEAYGWQETPRYTIRDRDRVYGHAFVRRLRAMGIRDRPIAPRSPWQNGVAERLIGSIRRDCLDHVAVFGERHLRHLLTNRTKNTTTRRANIYHFRRTRRFPVPSRRSVRCWLCQFWADYTINTSECEFPTGTPIQAAKSRPDWKAFGSVTAAVIPDDRTQVDPQARPRRHTRCPFGGQELVAVLNK
jgi:hypothetical protein